MKMIKTSEKVRRPIKIILIRNDCIGDMVISSGVFREIKKKHPDSKITVLCSSINKELIEKNKNVDGIIVCNPFWREKTIASFNNYFKIIKRIKKEKFDIGIDLRSSYMTLFFFLYLGRIKKRVAYYDHPFNKSKRFLTDALPYKNNITIHASINDLNLVNFALNMDNKDNWPDIVTDKEDVNNLKAFVNQDSNMLKPFICIVPDASSERKQWSLNKFNNIIKYIRGGYPEYDIFLVGSNAKKINYLWKRNRGAIRCINQSLRMVYLLFKRSNLIIAPDGGPMHLAWAAKTKLIALIPKYLSLEHMGPLNKNSHVIYSEISEIKTDEIKKLIDNILIRDRQEILSN
ncbi:MAG: hypothetical protein KJ600_05655 [Nanoarchaeota archaeon]|nr:hypothetical protein [Nanoarchaeota archaeon]MBU1104014.1 hypothetical protein [Nanoarchaeota archaeon]